MTHQFRLYVDTDNAAFSEERGVVSELGRILRDLAERLERGEADTEGPLQDGNGNTVGRYFWGRSA